jgi:GntR family transcriptional regulator
VSTQIAEPARSKHALIAEALADQIQSGDFKIGELLPSEAELGAAFGVSRHTVRIALRTLHTLGLVVSHQGVGTKVHRAQLASRYSHSFNSASDLLQYATTTQVKFIDRTQLVVNEEQAGFLRCKAGERWWRVRTLRFAASGSEPVAYSEIHVPLAFGAVLSEADRTRQPIFALIEQRFREPVVEIKQDIAAVNMSAQEAAFLQVPRKTAGLEIIRRYINKQARILEVARSLHPPGTFKYSMDVHLQHGA